MRILFIDLAHHEGLIACVDGERVASSECAGNRVSDKDLVPLIEKLLKQAGWTMKDLGAVACVTGPGGFTSLKVAVSAANALAWSLHIPIAGIHGSELVRACSTEEDVIWLHSTKKEEMFVCGFGSHVTHWPEPIHRRLEAFASELPPAFSYIGEVIPEHEAWISEHGGKPARVVPVEEILPRFLAPLPYGHDQLTPWYGREG
jgi:tRNA threonylcarbamoyl adenosine modification protein YeaZ